MNYIITLLIIGASGLIGQILILRELLINFYGNELIVGIILGNWVFSEAIGAYAFAKYTGSRKNPIRLFTALQILFAIFLPLSIFYARTFKIILGIIPGETIGLFAVSIASLLIILPTAFIHGALFSCSSKILALIKNDKSNPAGNVYSWETCGTILGGIILTYFLIPRLNTFAIVFLVSFLSLSSCLFFYKMLKKLKFIILLGTGLIIILFLYGGVDYLQRTSLRIQWKNENIVDYQNSAYGNILVSRRNSQYTFFHNGLPIITLPYPDITFVQEFGNIPLLFHKDPKKILMVGAGAGGLINEILNHPVESIDYAEIDPLIITMLRKYSLPLTARELSNPKTHIIYTDGRFFIRTKPDTYDIILIGISNPADLTTNRFFTKEFFALAKKRLKDEGILTFYLPGSYSYLSQELKNINGCILNAAKETFSFWRVIPGDYNLFLVSDSPEILKLNASGLDERIVKRNIKRGILTHDYLQYRLSENLSNWFHKEMKNATKEVNLDGRPFAVYQMLILWNKQFSNAVAGIFSFLEHLKLGILATLIILITLFVATLSAKQKNKHKTSVAYAILTTGFFAMIINLILLFSFQIYYGTMYKAMGLVIAIFMSGIALGSIIMTRTTKKPKNLINKLVTIESLIVIFIITQAVLLSYTNIQDYFIVFVLLFFVAGVLAGSEFPLAARIWSEENKGKEAAGLLYFYDLAGGWIAGILGGIFLLPVLGLWNTSLITALWKATSLIVLFFFSRKRLTNVPI